MRFNFLATLALILVSTMASVDTDAAPSDLAIETGVLGKPRVMMPENLAKGEVLLLSDSRGWSPEDESLAAALRQQDLIVVAIDTRILLASLNARSVDDCIYLLSDIEALSHQVQRSIGGDRYQLPTIAGTGDGATLALAIAAQTPNATIKQTIAIDPAAVLPLTKILCSDAPRRPVAGGVIYGLSPKGLKNPVDVLYTSAAPADGRAHIADLQQQGFAIQADDSSDDPHAALLAAVMQELEATPSASEAVDDLPLVLLPVAPKYKTMAIIYSGDGGWRDIDKSIGDFLQKAGIPTVGVDSLQYFWSEKTPAEIATDMTQIVDTYAKSWGADRVILVGYSFGADVLPSAYNLLSPETRSKISDIALLGPSKSATFQISVGAFLGTSDGDQPTLPEISKIDASLLQCFYGEEDTDSICADLGGTKSELIKTPGGHHFDGNYDALAQKIVEAAERRYLSKT